MFVPTGSNWSRAQRKGYPPRGLVLAIGEQYPEGESITARLFGLSLRPGEIDLDRLTAAQADASAGLLARCLADHLRAMAGDYPRTVKAARERWVQLRAKAMGRGMDGRTQEQAAHLIVGCEAALSHWTRAGAMTAGEQAAALAEGWDALCTLAKAHEARIKSEQPAETFIHNLRELFAAGAVHVRSKEDDKEPVNSEGLGWRGQYAKGEFIGWHSARDSAFYLMPSSAMVAVSEHLARAGQRVNLRPADL